MFAKQRREDDSYGDIFLISFENNGLLLNADGTL